MKNYAKTVLAISITLGVTACTWPTQSEPSEFASAVVHDIVSAVIKPDGSIWTWGFGSAGTLGNGSLEWTDIPVQVLNISGAVAIDLTYGMAVAVDQGGNIWYWGRNTFSSKWEPDIAVPVKVAQLADVIALHLSAARVHLLRNDGTVWRLHKLASLTPEYSEPIQVAGVDNIVQLTEYRALSADGILYDIFSDSGTVLLDASTLPGIAAVEHVYNRRTLTLMEDGTVRAWGKNDFGQLGDGTFQDSDVPVQVVNLDRIIAISANYDYNLALRDDGTVWLWGLETPDGQNSIGRSEPVMVEGLENVKLIYAYRTNLIMKADRSFWHFLSDERVPVEVQF